jgi:hypothetical protein
MTVAYETETKSVLAPVDPKLRVVQDDFIR